MRPVPRPEEPLAVAVVVVARVVLVDHRNRHCPVALGEGVELEVVVVAEEGAGVLP